MATLLLMLLLPQEAPVEAEKVWKGSDWKGTIRPVRVRTREDWERVWKAKGEPAPDVDFAKSWVLTIFRGGNGRPLGLAEVDAIPGGAVVVYSDPAEGVVTGKPFTSVAYLFVQLPKRADKIRLKVRWRELPGAEEKTDDDPRWEWSLQAEARGK